MPVSRLFFPRAPHIHILISDEALPPKTGRSCIRTTLSPSLAAEIEAEIIFKATNVDGVYDKDPNKFSDAVKYDRLTHSEVLSKELKVMDSTAASLCRDNKISILVFNLDDPKNIVRALKGEAIGTVVE